MTARKFHGSNNALKSEDIIVTEWVHYTNDEKNNDKAKKLIGGYLKQHNYKNVRKAHCFSCGMDSTKL